MNILIGVFFLSLLLGQFGGYQITPGITIFMHDVLSGILCLFFIFHQSHKKNSIKGVLLKPFFLFVSVAAISLLLNVGHFSYIQLFLGSLYLWRFILYFGLYVLVRNERLSQQFWINGLYVTGVGIALLGFAQYIFYPSLRNLLYLGWDEHYYRLFSTLLDPNFTGLFLGLTFFLGLYLYHQLKTPSLMVGQLVVGVAIILTYSRSSFLAFSIGLLVYVLLTRQKVLLLSLFFGALIYLGLPSHGIDANRLFRSTSSVARLQSYADSIPLVMESPIIGIGYNMLRYQTGRDKILDSDGIISRDAAGLNSSLLVVLVTTGIIGFCVFMYFLYKVFLVITFKKNILSYVGVSSFLTILIHSMFNNSLFYAWILIWMWIFVGCIELKNGKE